MNCIGFMVIMFVYFIVLYFSFLVFLFLLVLHVCLLWRNVFIDRFNLQKMYLRHRSRVGLTDGDAQNARHKMTKYC